MGIFGTQKILMCTLFGGRGAESQKVYSLYNHENVDINGRPPSDVGVGVDARLYMCEFQVEIRCYDIRNMPLQMLGHPLWSYYENRNCMCNTGVYPTLVLHDTNTGLIHAYIEDTCVIKQCIMGVTLST